MCSVFKGTVSLDFLLLGFFQTIHLGSVADPDDFCPDPELSFQIIHV
jgi:hypothetical protein